MYSFVCMVSMVIYGSCGRSMLFYIRKPETASDFFLYNPSSLWGYCGWLLRLWPLTSAGGDVMGPGGGGGVVWRLWDEGVCVVRSADPTGFEQCRGRSETRTSGVKDRPGPVPVVWCYWFDCVSFLSISPHRLEADSRLYGNPPVCTSSNLDLLSLFSLCCFSLHLFLSDLLHVIVFTSSVLTSIGFILMSPALYGFIFLCEALCAIVKKSAI